MRKALTIGGLALAGIAAAALAGVGLPEGAHGQTEVTRTITVMGEGVVEAKPDEAAFSFGVDTRAETARAASAQNAAAMRRLIDALKAAGVSGDDLQTEHVSVWPNTTEDGVSGFVASSAVRVSSAVSEAPAVVQAATEAGANTLYGPTLTRADTDALEERALELALSDARRKARSLADAADARLGEVLKMVEGGAVEPVAYEGAARTLAKDAAMPIEPGKVETRASLTVTFVMA